MSTNPYIFCHCNYLGFQITYAKIVPSLDMYVHTHTRKIHVVCVFCAVPFQTTSLEVDTALDWGITLKFPNKLNKCVCSKMILKIGTHMFSCNCTHAWRCQTRDTCFFRLITHKLSGERIFKPNQIKNMPADLHRQNWIFYAHKTHVVRAHFSFNKDIYLNQKKYNNFTSSNLIIFHLLWKKQKISIVWNKLKII